MYRTYRTELQQKAVDKAAEILSRDYNIKRVVTDTLESDDRIKEDFDLAVTMLVVDTVFWETGTLPFELDNNDLDIGNVEL